jgi:hypothetical protein
VVCPEGPASHLVPRIVMEGGQRGMGYLGVLVLVGSVGWELGYYFTYGTWNNMEHKK